MLQLVKGRVITNYVERDVNKEWKIAYTKYRNVLYNKMEACFSIMTDSSSRDEKKIATINHVAGEEV